MALYGDLTFDSRVRREATTLAQSGYDVTLVCLAGPTQPVDLPTGVHVVFHRPTQTKVLPGSHTMGPGAVRGRLRGLVARLTWLLAYIANLRAWGRAVPSVCGEVDAWHLHDLTALAGVLPALGSGVPVVYDAHELFLESGTAAVLPAPIRRLLRAYERRLVARVSAIVTVNDALASVLRRRYGAMRVEVVHNCPDRWWPPAAKPTLIRDATGIPVDEPVVLYHGALGMHRGIEQLMDALLRPGLEKVHLVLLGPGVMRATYVARSKAPEWTERVHILDPVLPAELLPWVASADIGALPIQRSTLNHYLSTPNKLFECLAAGIPVVASDFPAMHRIVMDDPSGPLGVVCDPGSTDDVAAAVRSLLDLDSAAAGAMRARCLSAAQSRWNWERESAALVALYGDLAPRRDALTTEGIAPIAGEPA
jgi:glycosyltransferase involved in cell wall biosynthesis